MLEGPRKGAIAGVEEEARGRFAMAEKAITALLPFFQRWTHGRLPRYARRRMDSGDLVQEAIVGVLRNLGSIETADPVALRKYLIVAIQNRICDEIRRANQGEVANLVSSPPDTRPSPLDDAIDEENRRQYRDALLRLSDEDQALLVGRIDMGLSFEELALVTGRPSPDAARNATRRAALRLARQMGRAPAGLPD